MTNQKYKDVLQQAVHTTVKRSASGKARRRTQKLLRRFNNSVDDGEILRLADAIEHRRSGFKREMGLE